jgi:hypothetical protein
MLLGYFMGIQSANSFKASEIVHLIQVSKSRPTCAWRSTRNLALIAITKLPDRDRRVLLLECGKYAASVVENLVDRQARNCTAHISFMPCHWTTYSNDGMSCVCDERVGHDRRQWHHLHCKMANAKRRNAIRDELGRQCKVLGK